MKSRVPMNQPIQKEAVDEFGKQAIRLTARDEEIIAHVLRYRITTIEALHKLFFDAGTTANAVSQVILRLCNGGYLQRSQAPLIGSQNFYQLTPSCARDQGEDEQFARPPGGTSLIFHYLMLEHCCLGEVRREHITAREIRESFPSLNGRGMARHGYFHTLDDPPRLGWLEADCGNKAETRAKKCLKQFEKRYKAEGLRFREFADQGRFYVALITPSEGKKLAFQRVLKKLPHFPIELVVSPRLGELLGRRPLQPGQNAGGGQTEPEGLGQGA
jgi:hypothetical protein